MQQTQLIECENHFVRRKIFAILSFANKFYDNWDNQFVCVVEGGGQENLQIQLTQICDKSEEDREGEREMWFCGRIEGKLIKFGWMGWIN